LWSFTKYNIIIGTPCNKGTIIETSHGKEVKFNVQPGSYRGLTKGSSQ